MSQENVRSSSAPSSPGIRRLRRRCRRFCVATSCGICLALTTGLNGTPTPGSSSSASSGICGLGVWVDHHLELLELLAHDDKVFCRYRQTATGKASGASVEAGERPSHHVSRRQGDPHRRPIPHPRRGGPGCRGPVVAPTAWEPDAFWVPGRGRAPGWRRWSAECAHSALARRGSRRAAPRDRDG